MKHVTGPATFLVVAAKSSLCILVTHPGIASSTWLTKRQHDTASHLHPCGTAATTRTWADPEVTISKTASGTDRP